MNKEYLYNNTNTNKFKLNELFEQYYDTFKKPLNISTIHIMGNEILEQKLINILELSVKNKKDIDKQDIEKFYPTTKGIVI